MEKNNTCTSVEPMVDDEWQLNNFDVVSFYGRSGKQPEIGNNSQLFVHTMPDLRTAPDHAYI
jgi:hypothetical protein